jgi:hypothetical protein
VVFGQRALFHPIVFGGMMRNITGTAVRATVRQAA